MVGIEIALLEAAGGNGAADTGAAAVVDVNTTTGTMTTIRTLGAMERMEQMKEDRLGAAATAMEKSEVQTQV